MTLWKDIVFYSGILLSGVLLGVLSTSACTPHKLIQTPNISTTNPSSPQGILITKPDGTRIEAPAGSDVKVPITAPKAIDHGTTLKEASGNSHGPKVTGQADKISQEMKSSAPTLDLDDGSGSGGDYIYKAKMITTSGVTPYVIFGIILIVAAALAGFWLKRWNIAIALAAAGLVIIAVGVTIDTAPWVFVLIPIALIVVIAVFIYTTYRTSKLSIATNDLVTNIENLMPNLITGIKNGSNAPITYSSIASATGVAVDKVTAIAGHIITALKKEVSNTSNNNGGTTSKVVKSIVG